MIGLFWGGKWHKSSISSKARFIELDLVLKETHSFDSELTEFPIESGSFISDHIIVKPKTLSMTGWISDYPLEDDHLGLSIGGRTQTLFDQLMELHDTREAVLVHTQYHDYQNMVMTACSIPRERNTYQALHVMLEFKEAVITTVRSVKLPPGIGSNTSASMEKKAKTTDSKGKKKTEANPEGNGSTSILNSTIELFL